jgi:hypothetical protein
MKCTYIYLVAASLCDGTKEKANAITNATRILNCFKAYSPHFYLGNDSTDNVKILPKIT